MRGSKTTFTAMCETLVTDNLASKITIFCPAACGTYSAPASKGLRA
jgi:hypothetical protein